MKPVGPGPFEEPQPSMAQLSATVWGGASTLDRVGPFGLSNE